MAKVDPDATSEQEEQLAELEAEPVPVAVPPEILANTLPEYVKGWFARVRAGDAGVLPVVVGLIIVSAIFQSLNSKFLSAGNIVNLLVQGSVYTLLAMAEVWVLLLGEIDLSAGVTGGVGMALFVVLNLQYGLPWPLALLLGGGLSRNPLRGVTFLGSARAGGGVAREAGRAEL